MQISVIIPTFNRGRVLLPRAIQSVLNQSFSEFELIIVDDCSTDETQNVVSAISDPRIVYFKRSQNGGIGAARNDGIRLARGLYITFLDSDDEFLPDYLQHAVACLDSSDDTVGFCWGAYTTREENTGLEKTVFWNPQKPFGYEDFLMRLGIGAGCGVSIKRSCFKEVGLFDETLRICEDTDFFLRLIQQFSFSTFEGNFIVIHYHNEERIRSNMTIHAEAYMKLLDRHKETILHKPELTEKWLYKLMWLNYHAGRIWVGNSYLLKLFHYRVASIKSVAIFLLFNILPSSWAMKIHKS